jgi:peptide/nickel transport system substrate-binding protein
MFSKKVVLLFVAMVLLAVIAACGAQPTPQTIVETVVVEKEVEGETVTVVETVEVVKEVEKVVIETVEVEVAAEEASADDGTLPRNETLYFNGQQWGPVVGWNPYSSANNNAMAIANMQDNARVIMFETPYLYNMLDGQVYPLLADGPFEWNDDRTEITFKIKDAAAWSDGTPVTAEDIAYTWATHVKYEPRLAQPMWTSLKILLPLMIKPCRL